MFQKKLQKIVVFAWATILMFGGLILTHFLPAIQGIYATFCGSIVALATAFFAGHVGAAWVDAKATPKSTPDSSKQPPAK